MRTCTLLWFSFLFFSVFKGFSSRFLSYNSISFTNFDKSNGLHFSQVNLHIFCQFFNPSFNYNIFQVLKGNFIRWQKFSLFKSNLIWQQKRFSFSKSNFIRLLIFSFSKNYFIWQQKDSHSRKAISFGGKILILKKQSHLAAKRFSFLKSYFIRLLIFSFSKSILIRLLIFSLFKK